MFQPQVQVVVQHRNDLPAGVPAVWMADPGCPIGSRVLLYLRDDLPQDLGDKFRAMCIRHALPEVDWDDFVIGAPASVAHRLIAAVAG